jgi:hypothetical protein
MKQNIIRNLSNIVGWSSNRKIIIIESDDWGSIRMPSLAAFERLQKKGVLLSNGDALRYNVNDTLAKEDDLTALFETLVRYKDINGNPAVFTPICLVANPDFEKIKENNFQQYYYESFTQTLDKYYGTNKIINLWNDGIKNKLFIPQFHGREHLNVTAWMKALQENDKHTHLAFEEKCWGFNNKNAYNISYQAAFDIENTDEIIQQEKIIKEGLVLFENIFGYSASFFVPPNGPFNNNLEKTAAVNGIKYMSSAKIQNEAFGQGKTKKKLHYLGQKNKYNQRYITRNCFFEPSQKGKDWVESCLNDIEIAFRWNKPAVISSHRVNYIGTLNEINRENGLFQLEKLLKKIINRWPSIEFMTSNQLGDLINKEYDKNKK